MAANNVKIEGLDALILKTEQIADKAMPAMGITSKAAAEMVMRRAQAKVRVDTGKLRSLLKVAAQKTKDPKTSVAYKVTFAKGGAYGIPLELGHDLMYMGHPTRTKVEARPFLRPAADESADEVVGMFIKAMNAELDKWGDGTK